MVAKVELVQRWHYYIPGGSGSDAVRVPDHGYRATPLCSMLPHGA